MIRILFVDDEPLILEGLRRTLRRRRDQWTMEFASGGAVALEAMEAEVFDVVVTDMKMPGMDGAELLWQVKDRFPRMIRLVLSGYADHDSLMRAVDASHQYLSKPCDLEVLKATIDQLGVKSGITGQVRHINAGRGIAAVLTEDGYSILELLDNEVDIGDQLRWRETTPLGGLTIHNLTRRADLDVFFQIHNVPWSQLREKLFL